MRIALIYDCLYPNTIGGAERWYRELAEKLSETHKLTYLTRSQWGAEGPQTPFETIAVAPGGGLYTASGRRGIGAPLRFGWGVFRHLLRHADRYDVVHTASFPYFSVLGAAAALRMRRSPAPLVVDWHELWAREYWREYLGAVRGRLGAAVQALCLRCPDLSFTFSRMVERRLREYGHRAPVVRLTGEYDGARPSGGEPRVERPGPPTVVFAGRHIPEKRVLAVPSAVALARQEIPDLACAILGEGPDTGELAELVQDLGLAGAIEIRGKVESGEVHATIAAAACLLHPSEREGYGQVVVEASACATPSVVVAGPENASTELVEAGVNGFVADSAAPDELAKWIVRAVRGGVTLRRSTLGWYRANSTELSLAHSLERVESNYGKLSPRQDAGQGLADGH